MERLRGYLCFKTPSLLLPTWRICPKLPSCFCKKPKGNATLGAKQGSKRKGLVSLYEDREQCAGYADIEIMWKMIHSSSRSKDTCCTTTNCKLPRYLLFCFRPS